MAAQIASHAPHRGPDAVPRNRVTNSAVGAASALRQGIEVIPLLAVNE
jgi:hypothetical protein